MQRQTAVNISSPVIMKSTSEGDALMDEFSWSVGRKMLFFVLLTRPLLARIYRVLVRSGRLLFTKQNKVYS